MLDKIWHINYFSQSTTYKKDFFWNMMGCGMNAASSVLMLLVVTRFLGEVQGGIFSIGYAIACQVWTFTNFETTTFHVTNTSDEYRHEHFFQIKVVLAWISIVASFAVIAWNGYTGEKAGVVLGLCVYKILDAFSNYFLSLFQKAGRLDVGACSYFWRVLMAFVAFSLGVCVGQNLLLGLCLACVVELAWVLLIEIPIGRFVVDYRAKWSLTALIRLAKPCFLIFLATFILMYVINVPKYTIDHVLDDTAQAHFNILFLPVAIINLLGYFIFRPTLTSMADHWKNRELHQLKCQIYKMLGCIGLMTLAVEGAGYLLGIPVLNLLYGVKLDGYRSVFLLILLSGGLYAVISYLYNVLVIMQKGMLVLIGYAIGLFVELTVSTWFVSRWEITGAAFVYFLALCVITVIMGIAVIVMFRKAQKINC